MNDVPDQRRVPKIKKLYDILYFLGKKYTIWELAWQAITLCSTESVYPLLYFAYFGQK